MCVDTSELAEFVKILWLFGVLLGSILCMLLCVKGMLWLSRSIAKEVGVWTNGKG